MEVGTVEVPVDGWATTGTTALRSARGVRTRGGLVDLRADGLVAGALVATGRTPGASAGPGVFLEWRRAVGHGLDLSLGGFAARSAFVTDHLQGRDTLLGGAARRPARPRPPARSASDLPPTSALAPLHQVVGRAPDPVWGQWYGSRVDVTESQVPWVAAHGGVGLDLRWARSRSWRPGSWGLRSRSATRSGWCPTSRCGSASNGGSMIRVSALLVLAACDDTPGTDGDTSVRNGLGVAFEVEDPPDTLSALTLRVEEVVFDGEGPDGHVTVSTEVGATEALVGEGERTAVVLDLPVGTWTDATVTATLASRDGAPALSASGRLEDDRWTLSVLAATLSGRGAFELTEGVDPSVTFELRPREWLDLDEEELVEDEAGGIVIDVAHNRETYDRIVDDLEHDTSVRFRATRRTTAEPRPGDARVCARTPRPRRGPRSVVSDVGADRPHRLRLRRPHPGRDRLGLGGRRRPRRRGRGGPVRAPRLPLRARGAAAAPTPPKGPTPCRPTGRSTASRC